LQGTFSASKHAVKGYTDALRIELEEAGAPVSVTLVKPSPTDTPYTRHARNHLDTDPQLTPPVYSPDVAADTILYCAENRKRDVYVGGGGKLYAMAGRIAPNLADRLMGRLSTRLQQGESRQRTPATDSMYSAGADGQERGDYEGRVMKSSLYSKASLHPKSTGALVLASGVVAGLLWRAYLRNGLRNGLRSGKPVASSEMRRLARKGSKVARSLPHVATSMRKTVEHNLPRH